MNKPETLVAEVKKRMEIKEMIMQLKAEKWPSRALDIEIAALFGFRRVTDPGSPKFSWHHPDKTIKPLPKFTSSMQDALELLNLVTPGCVGGCSWENNQAIAKIENGPHCIASTPAIAICIAALVELHRLRERAGSRDTKQISAREGDASVIGRVGH